MAACRGQIRVARAVLDVSVKSLYNLTVIVRDDGAIPLNASATFLVRPAAVVGLWHPTDPHPHPRSPLTPIPTLTPSLTPSLAPDP